MAAFAIPALISAGSSLLSGFMGSSAAKKASGQQTAQIDQGVKQVADATAGAQKGMGEAVGIANTQVGDAVTGANSTLADVYGQQKQALNPYLAAGAQGVSSLADMYKDGGAQFSFSPQDFAADPQFDFLMKQGTAALGRSAAASGTSGSGGTLASLMKYGQGLASTQYGAAYDRAMNTFQTNRNNTFQGLSTLAGMGQTATGQFNQAADQFGQGTSRNLMAGGLQQSGNTMNAAQFGGEVGMRGATSIADLYTQKGNSQAAGTMGSANAWSSALGGIGNAAQAYQTNRTMASMFAPKPNGGGVQVPMIGGQPWGGGGYSPSDYAGGM